MGRMQNNMLASSGSFGQVAAAVGPAGIAAAAFIGGAVVAERAAERWNIALKSVANAEGIKQATAAYSELSSQLQKARMDTGLGADVITNAGKNAAQFSTQANIGQIAEAGSIWASRWAGDAGSITKQMGNIGASFGETKGQMDTFFDREGSAIDILNQKFAGTGTTITESMSKMAPAISLIQPPEAAIGGWTALTGVLASFGQQPRMIATEMTALVQSLSQSKVQIDMSKMLGIDVSTFKDRLKNDLAGLAQDIAKVISPDQLKSLGGGKTIIEMLGSPARR